MFLAGLLTGAGFVPERIATTAKVHLGAGPTITLIELNTQAEVPNLTEAELHKHADEAKKLPVVESVDRGGGQAAGATGEIGGDRPSQEGIS